MPSAPYSHDYARFHSPSRLKDRLNARSIQSSAQRSAQHSLDSKLGSKLASTIARPKPRLNVRLNVHLTQSSARRPHVSARVSRTCYGSVTLACTGYVQRSCIYAFNACINRPQSCDFASTLACFGSRVSPLRSQVVACVVLAKWSLVWFAAK